MFRRLADSLSVAMDDHYYDRLVESLAAILSVDHVMLARLDTDGAYASTLAMWSKGRLAENFSYRTTGTPSEQPYLHKPCRFLHGICQQFPNDPMLAELGAEAYIGLPISTIDGRSLGWVAVIHGASLDTTCHAEDVLRLAAACIGAELARQDTEALSRKQLHITGRALKLLQRCNEALFSADSERQLLMAVCRLAVEAGGYRLAWVSYIQQDSKHITVPQAYYGAEDSFLAHLHQSWSKPDTYIHGPLRQNGSQRSTHSHQ